MTSETLHEIITEAIADRPRDGRHYYHLCWWGNRLRCLPTQHTQEKHEIFFMAQDDVLEAGLSQRQIDLIAERVQAFCSRRGIRLTRARQKPKAKTPAAAERELQITDFDMSRLQAFLNQLDGHDASRQAEAAQLQTVLAKANVVPSRDIPDDVVTLNSKVRLLDDRSNESMVLSLVFPADGVSDGDMEEANVSVLSPMGASLLGRHVGERIEKSIRVDALLYQPEAAGDYHL